MTLREFCDANDREAWAGLSSAFRSGAKAALTGAECKYLFREDFAAAWTRGFSAATEALAAGASISLPDPGPPRRRWTRRPYGGHRTR